MMTQLRATRSLRRLILGAALTLGALTLVAMLGFIILSASIRRTVEAGSEQLRVEQRIADQIVSASYSQQVLAYKYLERPSAITLAAFRERGNQAYQEIRRYLFRELPLSSRLEVEAIKEAHQHFEVTAERAFDLAKNGQADAARSRIELLSYETDTLERTVKRFVDEREQQRRVLQQREDVVLGRLQWSIAAIVIALALARIVMVTILRRHVMMPFNELSVAAGRLAEDTDGARMPPQRYVEFELLAESFNSMANRIEASRDEIGTRNQELTFALDHLQRTQQQLVQNEKLSAMGEMLAGLAHELNNPLGGILGIAECLKADLADVSDERTRNSYEMLIEPLVAESHRARELVLNLLHFARRSAQQVEAVRLAEPLNVAVGLRRHAFNLAQKQLVVDVPDTLWVRAQTQKLEHAIINVMNNALDAFAEGPGSRLSISAEADPAGEHVTLVFEDDGPGFSHPDRVFEPFFTTKEVGRGTGLGLALVHQFVEEFGGVVRAENRPNGGARLSMRLASAPAVATRTASSHALPTPVRSAQVVSRERQRILIVDDEPALRTVQVRLLAGLPVDTETASSGAEARDALSMRHFDIVITDLRMPGEMSGRDLLTWIARERPALADHVLVVTGDISPIGTDGRMIVSGDRVLKKPFSRDEYIARVLQALEYSAARARAAA